MDKDGNHLKLSIIPPQPRKKRVHFTKKDDIEILDLVIQEDPFLNNPQWKLIAETIKARRKIEATTRNVREHVVYLIEEFDKTEPKLTARLGQEECVDELLKRLTSVSRLKKYADDNPNLVKKATKRPYDNRAKEVGKALRDSPEQQRLVDTSTFSVEISTNPAITENIEITEPQMLAIGFPMSIKSEEKIESQQYACPLKITSRRQDTAGISKRPRTHFTEQDDLAMLRLVVQENPFTDHTKWLQMALKLKRERSKNFTPKNMRERVQLLIKFYDEKLKPSSGQTLTELEKTIQAASELKESAKKDSTRFKNMNETKPPITNPGAEPREYADLAHVGEDHRYSVKVAKNDAPEEVIVEDEIDSELGFMTGDFAASPAESSASLPSPTPPVATSAAAPLRPVLPKPPPGSISTQSPQNEMKFRVLTLHKSSVDQNVWENLKDEREYKSQVVALEMLKAENEKRKLIADEAKAKMDYELESKRIKLKEQQLNLMKQCLEQNQRISEAMLIMLENVWSDQDAGSSNE